MIAFRVVRIALLVAAVESMMWLFGIASIHRGNPYRLYDQSRLAAEIRANLPAERAAPKTGWPSSGARIERNHPSLATRVCGSAWGGSFTFGDDVPDDKPWPYLASVQLGCEIKNFGIDGFGFDQSLLFFREHLPYQSVVILGMAQPMITVGVASSLAFLDLRDHLPQAKTTKPFFTEKNGVLILEPRPAPTVDAIWAHYSKDGYGRDWTPLRFPFSISVALAIYRKLTSPKIVQMSTMSDYPEMARQRELASLEIIEMAEVALQNKDRFVVLLIPRPQDSINPDAAFVSMLNGLAAQAPEACLIDPSKELRLAAVSLSTPDAIRTTTGHFSSAGNAALADALVRGLAGCGIKP